jgi:putative heme transporter
MDESGEVEAEALAVAAPLEQDADERSAGARSRSPKKIIGFIASMVIVVGIFAYAIPKFADYSAVWAAAKTMTPIEISSLVVATVFNLFTYWWANMAALPGLRLWPAAVLTSTTTSVANTLPGGGAIAVGLTYTMQRSWGFTGTDTALYVGVTGIWNIFAKLALPVLSIAILVLTGQSSGAYVMAAVVGVAILAVAVGLLAAVFRSDPLARTVGRGLGNALSFFAKPFRRGKGPITGMDDRASQFRSDTIGLVEQRWIRLTFFTLLSQIALFFVLLLALRHMGVSEADVSAAKVFAVYSFSRLLSAVPITPGGVGVIDLGYVGGLTSGLPESEHAAVVAAVLIFRLLTYGIQIPLGGFTYFIWLKNKSWRRAPDQGSVVERQLAGGEA